MPIKGGSSVGIGGGLLLYGVTMSNIIQKVGLNVVKASLNVSLRKGKLGRLQNLTLEMNHLAL